MTERHRPRAAKDGLLRVAAAVALVLLCAAGTAPAYGAVPAGQPLPSSDYSVRPLCGAALPGSAQCFALQLVPKTAAAQAHSHPLAMTRTHAIAAGEAAEGAFGLRPRDLHSAYGLPAEAPIAQTVAIVDAYDDPTAEADLAVYSKEFGLPACTKANGCFEKVNQSGAASPLPATEGKWAGEIALDVEAAHAICQNCHILLVEADNAGGPALEAAEETASSLGATEISNSYGGPESSTDGAAYDHPGIPITASTGDYGYLNWDTSAFGFAGHPNYPASSPHVLAVGGTRLSVAEGAWKGESVWNDGSTLNTGFGAGGGGCSEHFEAPAWQRSLSDWGSLGCGEDRAAADLAADGDPFTGIAVYDSTPEQNGEIEPWKTVGGTSLSAPIVAAVYALAGGSGGVSFPAQTLYSHLGSGALHDVTQGSNGRCEQLFDTEGGTSGCSTEEEEAQCGAMAICRAAPGYDGPSGVGTPDGIAAFAPPTPSVTSVAPAEGGPGASVTISGEDLKGVVAVEFGGAKSDSVIEDSASELTVRAPEHAAGVVDVTVTTAGGTSATGQADRFTYLSHEPLPVVTSLEPAEGAAAGGTLVKIRGERLQSASAVQFGSSAVSSFEVKSAQEIQATAPAHAAGSVDVEVTTTTGTSLSDAGDRYAYRSAPTESSPPSIAGDAIEGATLTADEGSWAGEPVSYAYQWLRCDASGEECKAIALASAPNYEPTSQDVGHELEVQVTASNAGGEGVATSSPTAVVVVRPSLTWSGAVALNTSGTYDFSEAGNWSGDVAPGTSIGTLSLPSLAGDPACASEPPSDFCYFGANDIAGLAVQKISIYDKAPYLINGDPITLGGGGIEAGSTGEVASEPEFIFPIALSAAQTWSVDGGSSGFGGLGVDGDVTGEGHPLTLSLSGKGSVCFCSAADDEVGKVQIRGADPAHAGTEAIHNGGLSLGFEEKVAKLDANDHEAVSVEDAMLSGRGATGPLTVTGGYLVPGNYLTSQMGALTVDGSLSLDSQTFVQLFMREQGGGAIQNTRIEATGKVNLGGAQLGIYPALALCLTLPEGSRYTLVKTTGQLEGAFQGIPNGATFPLDCLSGSGPTLKMQYSEHEATVTAVTLPANSSRPTISGKAVEGETLTADRGTWEHGPTSYSYKWLRCNGIGSSCKEIAGETGESILLGAADVGSTIEVEVSAQSASGEGSATSAATAIVAAKLRNTAPPSLFGAGTHGFGIPVEGESVNIYSPGTWEGSPTSISYQWMRCDASGGACAEIAGATGYSYTLRAEDAGYTVRAREDVANSGDSGQALSPATPTVVPHAPASTSPPSISGNAIEGETLTASDGAWQPAATGYAYQWLRCDEGGGCGSISGATSQSYQLVSADVGHTVEVQVTAENAGGQNTATSAASAVIQAQPGSGAGGGSGTGGGGSGTGGSGTGGGSGSGGGSSSGAGGGSSSGAGPTGGSVGSGAGGGGAPTSSGGTAQTASATPVKGGKTEIKLTCPAGRACSGSLQLRVRVSEARKVTRHGKRTTVRRTREVVVASSSFSLAAGASTTLRLKLTSAGMALLRKAGGKGLGVKLSGSGIAARTVLLKEEKKKKRPAHH